MEYKDPTYEFVVNTMMAIPSDSDYETAFSSNLITKASDFATLNKRVDYRETISTIPTKLNNDCM
jgi:hypothetical protein